MLNLDIDVILQDKAQTAFLTSKDDEATIAQTLIALANNRGGAIVVGINQTGTLETLPQPQLIQDQFMQAALLCDPPLIIPAPGLYQYKKQPILIATVPPDLPHVYNVDGRYLIWEGGQPVPLSGMALRHLIFARGEATFEGSIVSEATPKDLDWDAIEKYVANVEGLKHLSEEDALIKRGCLKKEDGRLFPTYAGLLLFGKLPQQWLPQAEITVARYAGLQMSDTFIRADLQGTLPEQAYRAEAFVLDNIGRDVRINALQRSEDYLYPLTAVREVIVNALCHRDYSIRGDNIRLFLFANRLECYSPGRLPGHITVNNILQERFSRNATIVQVLFDMGFIERLGYGIDRIIHSAREMSLPEPEFEERVAGFHVTLYSQIQASYPQEMTSVREWLEMGLNNRQILALTYLMEHNRINSAEYQTLCPDVSSETLRRDLADLVERNLLLRIGEKRATFYILK